MAAKKVYIVTAALVITKKGDGSDLYLYQAAQVPDFVSDEELQRLSDGGFIAEVTQAEAAAADPSAESN